MENFELFASPWWVNLTAFIPLICWFIWRKGLSISRSQLIWSGIFAIAFGFTEAIVVVYLRVIGQSGVQVQAISTLPQNIIGIEMIREFCTLVMLATVALFSVKSHKERWAIFFFTFAIWDIVYYLGLRLFDNWPSSLLTPDVIFLLPVPWYSQVWFPILVSSLLILAVLLRKKKEG